MTNVIIIVRPSHCHNKPGKTSVSHRRTGHAMSKRKNSTWATNETLSGNGIRAVYNTILPSPCENSLSSDVNTVSKLVNWYFESSQPQRNTSRLKTMFNLSPIYTLHASHQTTNYSKATKSVLYTNLHKTTHRQTSNTKFSN